MTIDAMVAVIKKSGLFDEKYYLACYPDVRQSRFEPILHYVHYGAKEGKNPSADFDTKAYVKTNSHVDTNPLVHYIIHGRHTTIGLCRYSTAEFGRKFDVFEEPYFSKRLEIFENITLRSLDSQSEKNFLFLVYHRKSCPANKRLIFKRLEAKHPYLINVYTKEGILLPDHVRKADLLTFRLDNDDGVPKDFIARLNEIRYKLKNRNAPDTVISCPLALIVGKISEKKFVYNLRNLYSNSMGLAMYSPHGSTIFDAGGHMEVKHKFPMEILQGQGGFQILHDSNLYNGSLGFSGKIVDQQVLERILIKLGYPIINLENLPPYDKEVTEI